MLNNRSKICYLLLDDGVLEKGYAIGYRGTCIGELCFNTSMTGYQEVFTDPSYYGQIMLMTYPHIGNYGIMPISNEAHRAMISGLITRSFLNYYSNPQAFQSMEEWLIEQKIVGISGVDTRKIVRHIRSQGTMNAIISSTQTDIDILSQELKKHPNMKGQDLACQVSTKKNYVINEEGRYKIAIIDYGIKKSIIKKLMSMDCALKVFNAKSSVQEIKEWEADGYFFSNGPGDPNAMCAYTMPIIKYAKNTGKPLFGICLGHQLMAISEGYQVTKMHVGHRGANHPVKNMKTNLVEITTQNHGFVVKKMAHQKNAILTHINLNDHSIEGLEYVNFPGFSVQYHPEASPGPHDSSYLFHQFSSMLKK